MVHPPEILAARLGARDATRAAVRARADAILARHGATRPAPGSDPEDPRAALFFVIEMAVRTHRGAAAPRAPIDAAVRRRFVELADGRPAREAQHGQLHIDDDSVLRRAAAVVDAMRDAPGPVVAVGDDDLSTLALRAMGVPDLHAIDVDPRLVAFLGGRGVDAHEADVFVGPVPAPLRGVAAVAVADPFRDLDGGLSFLTFGAACLRRDAAARLLWADHPDWHFEQPAVAAAMKRLGFRIVETHEDLHAYPLDADAVEPDAIAGPLAIDRAWMRGLVEVTAAFSHLYVLERRA